MTPIFVMIISSYSIPTYFISGMKSFIKFLGTMLENLKETSKFLIKELNYSF